MITFFSKKLSRAETDYTVIDREILAFIRFTERFRCYLDDSKFDVISEKFFQQVDAQQEGSTLD